MFLETNHQFISPDVLSKIKQHSRKPGKRKVTSSYSADNEVTQGKVTEENRKEHPLQWKLRPRDVDVSQGTEWGKSGRSHQESQKKRRHPEGDLPDRVTKCERRDREQTNIHEHQRHLRAETPFQNKSEPKTSDLHQTARKGKEFLVCETCGKSFNRECHLICHKRNHTGERPFSCTECGKCFNRKDSLRIHQKIHTGEKPFQCNECGKWFLLKQQLAVHQKIHTGEKPFACTECGKCFGLRKQLVVHHRTHTGERAFPCTECTKAFTRKECLEKHLRIHTGEKPFPCKECGELFRRKDLLALHLRNHQGMQKPREKLFKHVLNVGKGSL
ncbi:gastrula zinc finger protein XlCGF17.1 isoform X2 [Microcaecilia unicolor]|uniref:Gastrula zinc finger protein XlCGF17.1-like isoform X2 n=1 Tax=Microcaecilia unicolor TaxID=1415580 RepID=A0A6P7X1C1_9AMPH|nr:gastrula zinc finger protein XlCGF17.1-like isoform X2 [Microcaecilia unicolor]